MPGVERTMREFKRGTLKSSSGKKVTSRKQAVAIAMSQENKMADKKPMKSRGSRPVTLSGKSMSARKPGTKARKSRPNVGTTKTKGWAGGKKTI